MYNLGLQKSKSQRVTIQFTVAAPETKRPLKAVEILKAVEMAANRPIFYFFILKI
jgi:hypothetical protein